MLVRMLQGPLIGQIVEVAAGDVANGFPDGWCEPVAAYSSYPWPYNAPISADPPPASYDDWVEAGSPPTHGDIEPPVIEPPALTKIAPTTADLGSSPFDITLTGTNFTPLTIVLVGDAQAVSTFVSATEITATITPAMEPPMAGNVAVSVRQGETTTDPQPLTFEAAAPVNNAPTAIDLSPATIADDAVVGDVVGALTATDEDDGDTFTYTLNDDASGAFALDGSNITVAKALTAGDAAINVTVADSAGGEFTTDLTITVTAATPEE